MRFQRESLRSRKHRQWPPYSSLCPIQGCPDESVSPDSPVILNGRGCALASFGSSRWHFVWSKWSGYGNNPFRNPTIDVYENAFVPSCYLCILRLVHTRPTAVESGR